MLSKGVWKYTHVKYMALRFKVITPQETKKATKWSTMATFVASWNRLGNRVFISDREASASSASGNIYCTVNRTMWSEKSNSSRHLTEKMLHINMRSYSKKKIFSLFFRNQVSTPAVEIMFCSASTVQKPILKFHREQVQGKLWLPYKF